MKNIRPLFILALIAGCAKTGAESGASSSSEGANDPAVARAAEAITAPDLLQHIKDLSDDSLEGRAPGTPGEDKAVAYLQSQFKSIGLAPGNPDGTYIQKVDLIGYTSRPTASFTARGKTVALKYPQDYVANSRHNRPETKIQNSD